MERRGNHLSKVSKTDPKNYTLCKGSEKEDSEEEVVRCGTKKEKSW